MTTRLVNQNRRKEQQQQERILSVLETKFRSKFAAEIIRASVLMLEAFISTGSAPSLPDDHANKIANIYKQLSLVTAEVFGGRVLDQGKSLSLVAETKEFEELFQRIAQNYISSEFIRRRITSVSESTRAQIIALIETGQKEGLGVDVIASNIAKALPLISKRRGALIARTETHGAANQAADQTARATGLNLKKEWVAVNDGRTRDFGEGDGIVDQYSHRVMDGVVVDIDQAFSVPDKFGEFEKMMFPGDPNGSAANTINCRCAISHIVVR